MKCPKCSGTDDKVIDSRESKNGTVIRRRRECLACNYRYTTYEHIERAELRVIKRDQSYEDFDRQKMAAGIFRACEKRPITKEVIEKMVDQIVDELMSEHEQDVPSTAIGEKVMNALRSLDEIAYVRFASVYRQFRDINEFVHEVQNLQD